MRKFINRYVLIPVLCMAMLCVSACGAAETSAGKVKSVRATVIEVEKFGHVVLDVTGDDLTAAGYALGDLVHVRFAAYASDMPYFDGYYCNPGSVMLRCLAPDANAAVCINYGDFSGENGVKVGDSAEITLVEKAGMLSVQEFYAMHYSDNRAEYADDAAFANFRAVTAGRIGEGKLYRTASPVNNKHGRAGYANDLIAAAGVATVLNLADADEDFAAYWEAEDFRSDYYRSLYDAGKVLALDMGANFSSEDFAASFADGFTFLAQNDPPYAVHCLEGKDRAGFAAMLLEALMGAELNEITEDYMRSFYHYYGIDKEKEPERYQAVLDINLIPFLCHVAGVDTQAELEQVDLESAVTEYLINAGMAEADLAMLKEKLS